MEIKNGVVKWFNDLKGYGFLTYDGGDIFVHWRDIAQDGHRSLVAEDEVTFKIGDYQGRTTAEDVKWIDGKS